MDLCQPKPSPRKSHSQPNQRLQLTEILNKANRLTARETLQTPDQASRQTAQEILLTPPSPTLLIRPSPTLLIRPSPTQSIPSSIQSIRPSAIREVETAALAVVMEEETEAEISGAVSKA
jgi:hypothetical protein